MKIKLILFLLFLSINSFGQGSLFNPTGTTYTGTANQVIVTGTVLSTPQSIATTSTPQFARIGIGQAASSTYGLTVTSATAGSTVFIQDARATTGQTTLVLKGGAVAGNIIEIRDSSDTLKAYATDSGVIISAGLVSLGNNNSVSVYTNGFTTLPAYLIPASSGNDVIGLNLATGAVVSFSNSTNAYDAKDTSISKISAGLIGIGTGAQGSVAGNLKLTHVIGGGTAPTVADTTMNSCGTTAATIAGSDLGGRVTVGATAGTSCTVTFGTAFTTAPACTVSNETTSNLMRPTASTTTLIIAGTMVAADKLVYNCIGY